MPLLNVERKQLQLTGDELIYRRHGPAVIDAILNLFAAACVVALTLLPYGVDQAPDWHYPWQFCSIFWAIAAGLVFWACVTLNRTQGITFNRQRGSITQWSALFGRRRETVWKTSDFTELLVTTFVGYSSRSGRTSRWYSLELRGPHHKLNLDGNRAFDKEESSYIAGEIAGFLGVPIREFDRDPGK